MSARRSKRPQALLRAPRRRSLSRRRDSPLVLAPGMAGSCRGWLPLQVPAFSESRPTLIFNYRGVSEQRGLRWRVHDRRTSPNDVVRTPRRVGDRAGRHAGELSSVRHGGPAAGARASRSTCGIWCCSAPTPGPTDRRRLILERLGGVWLRAWGSAPELLLRHTPGLDPGGLHLRRDGPGRIHGGVLREGRLHRSPTTSSFGSVEACLQTRHAQNASTRSTTRPWSSAAVTTGSHRPTCTGSWPRASATRAWSSCTTARHLVMAEAAERFNQVVLQFLDSESD